MVPEQTPTAAYRSTGPDEIVIGLVYGAGTETRPVMRMLDEALQAYGYARRALHLSDYFPAMLGKQSFKRESPTATRDLQDFGDELRKKAGRPGLLAQLAIYLIAAKRARDETPPRTAWIVRSLRRPEEVTQFRKVYGPRFILLAIHTPEPIRQRNAEENWQRWATTTTLRYEVEATRDIQRDELDTERPYGQRTRDTFAQADFFIDARSEPVLNEDLVRCVRLIFGWPFIPPTRDEQAMYHAFTASLRSSEMGRQVGAAIAKPDGEVLAVGTNDVPSGRGGLYWSPDQPDNRDFARQDPSDSNTLWQRRIARELLVRMASGSWLENSQITTHDDDKYDVTEDQLDGFLELVEGTRFAAITEFGRAVHAEMDALTTAARLGISVAGATLVCTTFPCHNCTRHLVAAGVKRVLYIHPYDKSLAWDLHSDAIELDPEHKHSVRGKVVFEQFVGVAPRGYPQYFGFGQARRRDDRGQPVLEPDPTTAQPRVLQESGTFSFGGPALPASQIAEVEHELVSQFEELIDAIPDITLPIPSKQENEI